MNGWRSGCPRVRGFSEGTSMQLARDHEKSPPSLGRRAFLACTKDRSAPGAEEAVCHHACCCNAAYNDEDELCEASAVAFRASPMFRTNQVDGNGGFAYVGSLFHGRKYSSGFKACAAGGPLRCFPARPLTPAASRQKNTRLSGPTSFSLRSLMSLSLLFLCCVTAGTRCHDLLATFVGRVLSGRKRRIKM